MTIADTSKISELSSGWRDLIKGNNKQLIYENLQTGGSEKQGTGKLLLKNNWKGQNILFDNLKLQSCSFKFRGENFLNLIKLSLKI